MSNLYAEGIKMANFATYNKRHVKKEEVDCGHGYVVNTGSLGLREAYKRILPHAIDLIDVPAELSEIGASWEDLLDGKVDLPIEGMSEKGQSRLAIPLFNVVRLMVTVKGWERSSKEVKGRINKAAEILGRMDVMVAFAAFRNGAGKEAKNRASYKAGDDYGGSEKWWYVELCEAGCNFPVLIDKILKEIGWNERAS